MTYWIKKRKMITLIIMIHLIGIFFVVELIGNICPASLMSNAPGKPLIITRKNDLLFTGISQIVSDENRIYVLFGTYSVVQVYTHEGEYLFTISVYNHVNGRTELATYDNQLYIRDKVGNVYVFNDNRFVGYVPREEAEEYSARLPYGTSDTAYNVRRGSICKTEECGTSVVVIQRPFILSIYQNNALFIIRFLLFVIIGFILSLPILHKRT